MVKVASSEESVLESVFGCGFTEPCFCGAVGANYKTGIRGEVFFFCHSRKCLLFSPMFICVADRKHVSILMM